MQGINLRLKFELEIKQIKLYKIHYSVSVFLKYLAAIFFLSACEALKSSYFIAVFLDYV